MRGASARHCAHGSLPDKNGPPCCSSSSMHVSADVGSRRRNAKQSGDPVQQLSQVTPTLPCCKARDVQPMHFSTLPGASA